ncbi:hypothetical protein C8J56DRAFT_466939 [Mycena floridula]|nr:hypothetical protein C8J56DRAFT_466939 [Mycena floridula]
MRVIVLCALIFTFSHLTLAAPVIFGPRTRVETSVEARGFMTSIKGFLGTTKTKAQNYLPKMFSTVNVVDNRFRKLAKSRDGMKLSPAVKENVKAKLVNLRRGLKKFQGSDNRQQVATLVDEVLSAIHLLRHGQGNQVGAYRSRFVQSIFSSPLIFCVSGSKFDFYAALVSGDGYQTQPA